MASLTDDRPDVERCDHPECRPIYVRYRRAGPKPGVRDGSYVLMDSPRVRSCSQPLRMVMSCYKVRLKPCDTRDSDRCESCADLHNRRLRRKLEEGLRTSGGMLYLVTLTAPGSIGHNRYIPGRRGNHGVCGCGDRVPDLSVWNTLAAACWNRLATRIRARYGPVDYARVCEVQNGKRRQDSGRGRGALHHHVLLALPEKIDPEWMHEQAMRAGYGCVVDIAPIRDPAHVAAYVSKYTTKGGRDRAACKWPRQPVIDVNTGELTWLPATPTYRAWSASTWFGPTIATLREMAREQAVKRAQYLRDMGLTQPWVGDESDAPAVGSGPAP